MLQLLTITCAFYISLTEKFFSKEIEEGEFSYQKLINDFYSLRIFFFSLEKQEISKDTLELIKVICKTIS